jgi:hypothetical protein
MRNVAEGEGCSASVALVYFGPRSLRSPLQEMSMPVRRRAATGGTVTV